MLARRSIPLLALAAMLTLATAAHAGPVGNQYLPKVPKAGDKDQGSGGASDETSSSSYTPTTTSSEPTQTNEKPAAKPKHHEKPKSVKVAPASSNGVSADSGSAWIPIAILVFAAIVTTAAGLTLRRRAA
jgi:cobalamin biosynthesis Mg chelatase CobN